MPHDNNFKGYIKRTFQNFVIHLPYRKIDIDK